jgi:hypothetical protein
MYRFFQRHSCGHSYHHGWFAVTLKIITKNGNFCFQSFGTWNLSSYFFHFFFSLNFVSDLRRVGGYFPGTPSKQFQNCWRLFQKRVVRTKFDIYVLLCGHASVDRKFQIFLFLIGYININNGILSLIISYLRIKSYNVLNYNHCSTDWSFPLMWSFLYNRINIIHMTTFVSRRLNILCIKIKIKIRRFIHVFSADWCSLYCFPSFSTSAVFS